jgi:hypothetical protein
MVRAEPAGGLPDLYLKPERPLPRVSSLPENHLLHPLFCATMCPLASWSRVGQRPCESLHALGELEGAERLNGIRALFGVATTRSIGGN